MDLKDFVTEALLVIQGGVENAITRNDEIGGKGSIAPIWIGEMEWKSHVEKVEFDVAVTATDKTSGGAKAGIKVFSITDFGGDVSKAVEKTVVSKVKFSVPVLLPASARHPIPQDEK